MRDNIKNKGVAVAQRLERRVVAPEVADSNSVGHSFVLDLEERIAIRTIDGGQDEEEARKKALAELEVWWEDLAT